MTDFRSGPAPVDRTRGEAPTDGEWRADALARSGHSRLEDELREPLEDHDPDRAAATCGEITRELLGDLAPALILLPPGERLRVQALTAFARTLFDFARQSSLEGEKLAQINRWCFDLEAALDGEPPGQPVFVLMAAAERQRPWPREALDDVAAAARNRAMRARVRTPAEAARRAQALGAALVAAILPEGTAAAGGWAGALVRVQSLLSLADDHRRHAAALPAAELPDDWEPGAELGADRWATVIRNECRRLRPLLTEPIAAPAPWNRALSYAGITARRHLRSAERLGAMLLETPPQLGAVARIALLLRCRWLPVRS